MTNDYHSPEHVADYLAERVGCDPEELMP